MTATPFILETERLGLALWSEADIEPLARLHGDEETTRYLSIRRIWTNEDAADRIASWMQEWREHGTTKLKLVRRDDGLMVGRAGFGIMADTGEYELGYTIDRRMRGKGYATEISLGLAQWFFAKGLAEHFIACADVDNSASNRVLEKIGMRYELTRPYDGSTFHFYRMDRA